MTPVPHFNLPNLPFDFAAGWAVGPFTIARTAHYFLALTPAAALQGQRWRDYYAACDVIAQASESVPMMGPGALPRCKKCLRALA